LKIYIKFKYNNITNYLIDHIYLSVYEEVSIFIETIYKDFKLMNYPAAEQRGIAKE